MRKIFFTLSIFLVTVWFFGFVIFNGGKILLILLAIAIILTILGIFNGKD